MRSLTVSLRYYRIHPYGAGMEQPAKGHLGYATKEVTLAPEETALILMHLWNEGFPEGPDPRREHPESCGYLEYLPRARPIIEERIVPLAQAAREAGLRIIHLCGGPYAEKYSQYRFTKELAGPEPDRGPGSVNTSWTRERAEECYGPGFWENHPPTTDINQPVHRDIPECAQPLPGDWMAMTGHQLNRLCRALGVWNLFYTGFLTNVCVMHSSGGMLDMISRGYRCVILRDCTTGGEQADTIDEQFNTRAAIRYLEYTQGYSAEYGDLLAAFGRTERD
jgi:nicotinamidase-related amidase